MPGPVRSSALPAARRAVVAAAATFLTVLATVGAGATPASAETVRAGCSPFGTFSGANHPGACWRPFSASSPFNQRLLPNDPRVVANSSKIVDRLNGFGKPLPLEFGPGKKGEGRGTKPIYFSTAKDPVYTIRFTEDSRNGGSWGNHPVNGMQVHIPEGARPGAETDRHMIVIDQTSGFSFDLWQVRQDVLRGGGTVTSTWGGRVSVDGDGRLPEDMGTGSAAGMGIAGGIVRPDELVDGDIPHALYMSAKCTNGTSVYPSTRAANDGERDCSQDGLPTTDAPALGQRFQLGYTDAQIAAMDVPAHDKVLLRAMAHYGLILVDTTPDPWHIDQESSISRTSLGLPDPGVDFAKSAGLPYWADGARYIWAIDKIPGLDGQAGSWTKALRVIKPCVSEGTCPAATEAPGAAPLWPAGSSVGGSAPASTVTAASTATEKAAVTVSSPAVATATATATATETVKVPVSTTAKKSPATHKKAKKAAQAKAKKLAKSRAKAKAKAKARTKAMRRAKARARRIAAR